MERNFFNDALRSEASLDHFHVYASSEASSSSSSSEKNVRVNKIEKAQGKHEHTDVGVAIVMTPAWVNGKDDHAGSRGLIVRRVSRHPKRRHARFVWEKRSRVAPKRTRTR